jgi:hypothetical protein
MNGKGGRMSGMVRGQEIVQRLRKAKEDFGGDYPKKFGGAAAVEILRAELREAGIETSRRDVFIRGIPLEIDLIVPAKGAAPWLDLLYDPQDVAVALEVKKLGAFGEQARAKIRDDFVRISKLGVNCAYVTFEDRENFRFRPTEKTVGSRCFALAWHKTDGSLEPTKDEEGWEAFVRFLRDVIAAKAG